MHYLIHYERRCLILCYCRNKSNNGKAWTPGTSGTPLSLTQKTKLQQIQDTDAEIDIELEAIEEGIDSLSELAKQQGEEVRRHDVMLEKTSEVVDHDLEHIENVNAKMNKLLEKVGRRSDKLCMDIFCIVSSVFRFITK